MGRALIQETYRRRLMIPVAHAVLFLLYVLCFLWPYSDMLVLGAILFVCGGIILPLLLSIGIFGDDIASGRYRLLASRPVRPGTIYGWRVTGVLLQGFFHLVVGSAILLVLRWITGRGFATEFGLWFAAAYLSFIALTTLSTSLSVVTKGDHNSVFLFLAILPTLYLYAFSTTYAEHTPCAALIKAFVENALPPDIILFKLAYYGCSWPDLALRFIHVFVLAALYSGIGILALSRREYVPHKM